MRKIIQGHLLAADDELEKPEVPEMSEAQAMGLLKVLIERNNDGYVYSPETRKAGWETLRLGGFYVELDGPEDYMLYKLVGIAQR
jgi:hypothetical protein